MNRVLYLFALLSLVATSTNASVRVFTFDGYVTSGSVTPNQVLVGESHNQVAKNLIANQRYDIFWSVDGNEQSNEPYFRIQSNHVGQQIQFCTRKRSAPYTLTCSQTLNVVNSAQARNMVNNTGYTTNYVYDKRKLKAGNIIASKANIIIPSGNSASAVIIYGKDQNGDVIESRFVPASFGLSDDKVFNVINRDTNLNRSITSYKSCSVALFASGMPTISPETCKGPFGVGPR